jgi:rhamnose utilization protein RhaD (predicted bifunctional aldolase and dehydrogenase)/NAD(P)-dependent dehydrogenase (short-subunit alcohol dehydrogenase family)
MKSLWSDAEAAMLAGPLGPRVYTSRLLGAERSLVLHGGGNTSVKLREKDVFGDELDVLYVKGSGADLASIDAGGFAPLRLAPVRRLAGLPKLSDAQMMNELGAQSLRADAPFPSVETLLHAILPQPYVDHTHADAVLAISNAPDGEKRVREIYGERVAVVPYIMAGFDLGSYCARELPKALGKSSLGVVLLSHGILSFGASARESYERMIELVTLAEEYLARKKAWQVALPAAQPAGAARAEIAQLRKALSEQAGVPLVLRASGSAKALAVAGFVSAYRGYFERHSRNGKTMLDPAPRVVLDPRLGLLAAGRNAREATIAAEIYDHTIDVILSADALGGWRAVSERDLFAIEYWELEQAKLRKAGPPPVFAGEVALVTGAASGIGRACVDAFLKRGAAVVGLDRNPAVVGMWRRPDFLGLACDLTDSAAVEGHLEESVGQYGGLDMLVLNAGIFPSSQPLQDIAADTWQRTMSVNVDAQLRLLQLCHPLLKLAPHGGRIVVIGSRNVPAPGPGAGAYSASKAALNQLARVAALEWAKDGIRINSLHPDAVYDTGLWTEDLLAARAKAYNLSVEQYRRKNLLKTEVASGDVAELAAEMCGPLFSKTTAAQVPVDGGNERVV